MHDDQRALLISPLYGASVASLFIHYDPVSAANDLQLAALTLCGLSAIYSCASAGYCHCDIKPDNIVVSNTSGYHFVLIDFGSATKLGSRYIGSTTSGISITRSEPTIGYDVSSLVTTLTTIINGRVELWSRERVLNRLAEMKSRYPVTIEALIKYIPIDEEIADLKVLEGIWTNCYSLIMESMSEELGDLDFLRFPKRPC